MSNKKSSIDKARFWCGILYPESMIENWEVVLPDIVQVPFAYCLHDKDLDNDGDERKVHLHLMLAFTNTTTRRHVFNVIDLLSAPNKVCCNTVQACIDVRKSYDYLIHDTEASRKQFKYQYDPSERITGNNFDIGAYEQLSALERAGLCKELCNLICEKNFTNFADFFEYVSVTYAEDMHYFLILMSYSGLFERLTKANFLRQQPVFSPSQGQQHASNTKKATMCCKKCGSVRLKKYGKTGSGGQRWQCLDCGKTFVF